ncbi:MAG: hypothetical protein K6T59_11030 [Bryobacteraceae bacterium]|nr:hypothetical protein [Bryobacteraceae bacterium]
MELLFGRYRHIAVMLAVIFAQLLLLAYQVKTGEDVRLIRVWAVSAITPLARLLDSVRTGGERMIESYIRLSGAAEENRRLRSEVDRLRLENRRLSRELASLRRSEILGEFQNRHPSRTLPARVIAASSGPAARAVFVDRGSADGVRKGMAVITPDGVVGRVIAVYPAAAQVLVITDPSFAAGVISEMHHVEGTLKGTGQKLCRVEYLQNEEPVERGEWFYTSGEDLVFPRGLPVGRVRSVAPGKTFKEVLIEPSGLARGLEEVLIVLEGVHQSLPGETGAVPSELYLLAPPGTAAAPEAPAAEGIRSTDADRLREHYRRLGELQGHVFGEATPGSKPPDFNWRPPSQPERPATPGASPPSPAAPQSAGPSGSAPRSHTTPPHGSAR